MQKWKFPRTQCYKDAKCVQEVQSYDAAVQTAGIRGSKEPTVLTYMEHQGGVSSLKVHLDAWLQRYMHDDSHSGCRALFLISYFSHYYLHTYVLFLLDKL